MANETISFGDGSTAGYPGVEDTVMAVRQNWTAAQAHLGVANAIHLARTDTGAAATVTTGITQPPCCRNITATSGGTAGDVAANSVIITGTDFADQVITETLPAFTLNTPGIVTGSKAFKTVTSIYFPVQDGTGATIAVGYGAKLGLAHYLNYNTVEHCSLAGTREGTAATVATSLTSLSNNTITLNSALNGTAVQAVYFPHYDQTYVG